MRLGTVQDDGHTLRWHLQIVHEQSGEMPADLDVPPAPHELEYLWGYFIQLNRKRTAGAVSPNPLSDSEILAWQARNRIKLDKFESDCIDDLDAVYLAQHCKPSKQSK